MTQKRLNAFRMKRILVALGSMLLAAPLGGLVGVALGLVASYLRHGDTIDYGVVPVAYWLGGASVGGLGGAAIGWFRSSRSVEATGATGVVLSQADEKVWPPPPRS